MLIIDIILIYIKMVCRSFGKEFELNFNKLGIWWILNIMKSFYEYISKVNVILLLDVKVF